MQDTTLSVASLLIPLEKELMLLPNAAVAEIIGYQDPAAVENGPDWLLGLMSWRGISLPLVSLEAMRGGEPPQRADRARIAVMNSVTGNQDLQFYAVVLRGIPGLVRATQDAVLPGPDSEARPEGVLCHALVNGEPAMIPDLDAVERMLQEGR